MNVIHIIPGVTEEASGPTYSVNGLCQALLDRGHHVTLASMDMGPLRSHPSYLQTFPMGIGPRHLGRSPAMYRWLLGQCKSGSTALLHNHGMWQMNSLYPAWAARHSSVRLVQSTRGAFTAWAMDWGSRVKPIFWRLLQEPAMRRVACFHATAEGEFQDVRRLGFRQPVAVIPNGIHLPEMLPNAIRPTRTLLFLGRLHPNKGLDLLIPAWREVQESFPHWRLRILGPDEQGHQAEMEALVQRLGAERVKFEGPAYGEAKLQAYREAELFILPSYSENFGMSVAEALAAGTPAIVTKGAPWSGLERQGAGWWIGLDVPSLSACLRRAMGCPPERLEAMGWAGRDWMSQEFSWGTIADRMAATYEWLCSASSQAPAWVRQD